jgi:hypothetical protein
MFTSSCGRNTSNRFVKSCSNYKQNIRKETQIIIREEINYIISTLMTAKCNQPGDAYHEDPVYEIECVVASN